MTAYWIVFAIMFLLQFIKVNTSKDYLWRLIISFIPLFIFAAFRVNFGLDYESYQETFDIVHAAPGQYDDLREEIGYLKLNEWLPTFRSLIILTSALTCTAYIIFFYRIIPANYSWLAVLLLFLAGDNTIFFMFSGIRNAVSISILILAFPLLQKRKLLPFVLCMLLAASFHKTAFVYFPIAYLVANSKDMARREILIWVGVFAFFFIFSHTAVMGTIESFMTMAFDDRYDLYLGWIEEVGDNRGVLGRVAMIVSFVPLLWYTYKGTFTPKENTFLRLGLMYAISQVMGALTMRTPQHFILFFIATTVFIFSQNKRNRLLKGGYVLFVLVYLAYALFVVYMGNPSFPYNVYESTIFGIIE